jgi:glycosyltransferase involved in cell wall biosynthesis
MEIPKLSVFTLSYNTGPFVIQALECIKNQKYPNLEHIIIDDCSTDDSANIIQNWIEENKYDCLFIINKKNKGIQKNFKMLFNLMTGKYFTCISDDLLFGNHLLNDVLLLEQLGNDFALIYGDSQIIDEKNEIIHESVFFKNKGAEFIPPTGMIFPEILDEFYFFIQASIIRKESFDSLKIKFKSKIISEDWYWQLCLALKFKIYGLNELRGKYRVRTNSVTQLNWNNDYKRSKVVYSHFNMIIDLLEEKSMSKRNKVLILKKLRILIRAPFATNSKIIVWRLQLLQHLKLWIYFPTVRHFKDIIGFVILSLKK